jgi:hypothetical protein
MENGLRLGPVGARIVGKVFIGLLKADLSSYLAAEMDTHEQAKKQSHTSPTTSYCQLAKSRWNDAAPASRNLQRNREHTPLWCDLRHNFVAGFQWPCRSLDFGLSGHTQSYFTARDFLHDEFLTFPVQHIAIDSSAYTRLRALQRLDLSDYDEHEKESKKNWHDHSSLFFSLLTILDTCQSGIRLPAKFAVRIDASSSGWFPLSM